MELRLILLRHAEIAWKRMGFLSSTDVLLTKRGIEQARKAGEALKKYGIDAVYSSPLLRCFQTAIEISKVLGLGQVIVDKRLREIEFGVFEGLSLEEARKAYPKIFRARQRDKWNYRIPGGESYADASKRSLDLLREVEGKGHKCVLFVTHVSIMKVLLRALCNLSLKEVEKLRYDPTFSILMESSALGWKAKCLGKLAD
jgi:broad specificity phosphatase PhoE